MYTALAGDNSTVEQSIGQNSTENKFAAGSQFWKNLKLILSLVHTSLTFLKSSKKMIAVNYAPVTLLRPHVPLLSNTTHLHRHSVLCPYFVLLILNPGV